jgi:hypothetical protein
LLSDYTLEELMIEYLEDLIEMEPHQEFPQDVRDSGQYMHRTGDVIFDSWQEKAASGEKIDFTEAFTSDEAKKQFEAIRERSREMFKKARSHLEEVKKADEAGDVHEDFTGGV